MESRSHSTTDWRNAWPWVAAGLLLLLHAIASVHTLGQKTATVDEVAHLPAGITYWQTGTFALYHHNPPLVKLFAALPALAVGAEVDYSKSWQSNRERGMPLSQWAFGWEFMYANAARYDTIYFWSRLPVVALSVLAGVVVFLWARQLFGPLAAVTALALWSFCPNVIAHSGMVTTDMGATSLGFVATYFFWRYLGKPSWKLALIAGVLLGLAQLAKYSSLLLYGLWAILWLTWLVVLKRSKPSMGVPSGRLIGHAAATVAVSVLVINIGYGFEGTGRPLGRYMFLSQSLTRPRQPGDVRPLVPPQHPWHHVLMARQNRFANSWLGSIPFPLPQHYLEGFDEQKLESEGFQGQGYPVYFRGELRRTGWWYYYFAALLWKVPLGTWLLTAGAAAITFARRSTPIDELTIALPVVVVLGVMSFVTDINLGLRYVLPIFPFWFVWISRVAAAAQSRRWIAAIVTVALAWNVTAAVRIHPHHLAYFNELTGGPSSGWRYLIDSNLDWGQDLEALARWWQQHGDGEPVGLAYFGNVDPSILESRGRGISFYVAPPSDRAKLRLVATRPGSPSAVERTTWIEANVVALQQWLASRRQQGAAAGPNDHPELRRAIFDQLELNEGPQPGLFAVSANFVAGLPFRLRDHHGSLWAADEYAYSYFAELTPIARPGYSIFIYRLSLEEANSLRTRLNLPALRND